MDLLYQYTELGSCRDLTSPEVPQHLEHSWWEQEVGEQRYEWEASTGEILAAVVAEDHLSTVERKAKMERSITVALETQSGVCHLT